MMHINRAEGEGGALLPHPKTLVPQQLHVLLVESKTSCRQSLVSLLHQCLYQVTAVKTGQEALQLLQKQQDLEDGLPFDLILKEHEPPAVNACRLLRKVLGDEVLRRVPVVVMSSQDDRDVVMKCLHLGAADYLIKPLRLNEFRNIWTRVWWRRVVHTFTPPAALEFGVAANPVPELRLHGYPSPSHSLSSTSQETKCDEEDEPTSKEGSAPDGSGNGSKDGNGSSRNQQLKTGHGSNGGNSATKNGSNVVNGHGSNTGKGSNNGNGSNHGSGNGNGSNGNDNSATKNGHANYGSNGNGASTTQARNEAIALQGTAEGKQHYPAVYAGPSSGTGVGASTSAVPSNAALGQTSCSAVVDAQLQGGYVSNGVHSRIHSNGHAGSTVQAGSPASAALQGTAEVAQGFRAWVSPSRESGRKRTASEMASGVEQPAVTRTKSSLMHTGSGRIQEIPEMRAVNNMPYSSLNPNAQAGKSGSGSLAFNTLGSNGSGNASEDTQIAAGVRRPTATPANAGNFATASPAFNNSGAANSKLLSTMASGTLGSATGSGLGSSGGMSSANLLNMSGQVGPLAQRTQLGGRWPSNPAQQHMQQRLQAQRAEAAAAVAHAQQQMGPQMTPQMTPSMHGYPPPGSYMPFDMSGHMLQPPANYSPMSYPWGMAGRQATEAESYYQAYGQHQLMAAQQAAAAGQIQAVQQAQQAHQQALGAMMYPQGYPNYMMGPYAMGGTGMPPGYQSWQPPPNWARQMSQQPSQPSPQAHPQASQQQQSKQQPLPTSRKAGTSNLKSHTSMPVGHARPLSTSGKEAPRRPHSTAAGGATTNTPIGHQANTGATSKATTMPVEGSPSEPSHKDRRMQALHKFKQKRKNLNFTKKIRYESRKQLAQARPRVKGQFVRVPPVDGADDGKAKKTSAKAAKLAKAAALAQAEGHAALDMAASPSAAVAEKDGLEDDAEVEFVDEDDEYDEVDEDEDEQLDANGLNVAMQAAAEDEEEEDVVNSRQDMTASKEVSHPSARMHASSGGYAHHGHRSGASGGQGCSRGDVSLRHLHVSGQNAKANTAANRNGSDSGSNSPDDGGSGPPTTQQ
ncbi:hypothetical protein WJX72_004443 [[Myrmecia] bisecta]|uniref:Pseudo-response regulator 1 n=1 Tax=[Myrmecia] bisecta TaxID=41462 RepID=A0AAW1QAD8_9CHLO